MYLVDSSGLVGGSWFALACHGLFWLSLSWCRCLSCVYCGYSCCCCCCCSICCYWFVIVVIVIVPAVAATGVYTFIFIVGIVAAALACLRSVTAAAPRV